MKKYLLVFMALTGAMAGAPTTPITNGSFTGTSVVQTGASLTPTGTGTIRATSALSPAATNLTLGTTSFGTGLTFTSATGAGVFAVSATSPFFVSTVATGTAPLTVSSTTLVANLHAATADSSTSTTNATNVGVTNDTTTNATMLPLWVTANTGNLPAKVTSTKLTFNPSTGILASTGFTGTLNGNTFTTGTYTLTGTAAKTLTFTNSLTLSGTDATTMTFPTTSATLARTDAANTFTGIQSFTSPDITTSITTSSTSFTAFAGATTLMTIGGTGASASSFFPSTLDATSSVTGAIRTSGGISAAKAANIGTTLNVAGISGLGLASSSTTNLNLAVSTTGVSSLRVGHGIAPSSPVNGDIWTTSTAMFVRINGATVQLGTSVITGTDTQVLFFDGANSPAGDAGMTYNKTTDTLTLVGSVVSGSGSSVAGTFTSTEGTAPSLTANAFSIYSPVDVAAGGLAYSLPAAASSGVLQATNTAGVMAITHSALTSGRVTFATTNGLLSDDSDLTFATDTLTATKIIGSTSITNSALTSGRVVFSGTAGIQSDDSDMTFATDTLTTTNHVVTTSLDVSATGVRLTGSNGSITFLGRGSGSDEDLKLDLDTTSNTALVTSSTGVVTLSLGAIGMTSTGTNSIGPLVDSVDGTTPLNNINQVVATGTAYTMTNAYGSLDFGTTDPILTIANAGTYAVYVDVQLNLVGATYATYDSATIKLRRTNNTAADLTGSTFGTFIPTITTITAIGPYLHVGPIKYTTANTNDTITVQGVLGTTPAAGSVTATACTITAIRAY